VRRVRAEEEAAERERLERGRELEKEAGVALRVAPAVVDADRAGYTGSNSAALFAGDPL
jgi:hypothetical protein